MDRERFDCLARTVGAAPSRRRLLGLAASSALTAVGLRTREAKAKGKRCHVEAGNGRCHHGSCVIHCDNPGGCSTQGGALPSCDRNGFSCSCVKLLNGESACVGPKSATNLCNRPSCSSNKDCVNGNVCAKVPGCCSNLKTQVCVFTCQ
jgi:hypothetical protein